MIENGTREIKERVALVCVNKTIDGWILTGFQRISEGYNYLSFMFYLKCLIKYNV